MIKIKFEGIDDWNRPVFKDMNSKTRFGSVDILFDYSADETTVLKKISEKNLCYFGNRFGCEPMGTKVGAIKIIKSAPRKKKTRKKTGTEKIIKAIQLIGEVKDLVDEALGDSKIKDYQFVSHYYTYGRYGINQLLGTGNPHDDSLFTLIEELKKEGL